MPHYKIDTTHIRTTLQNLVHAMITATTAFFLMVIFLGLPYYYGHSSPRSTKAIIAIHQQVPQHPFCEAYIGSWKAIRNLAVVASGYLTAILFKLPAESSPEFLKLLLIYPALVLSILALITSSMFIAHFDGETHRRYAGGTERTSLARSVVFAIPGIMLVWGMLLVLAWVAYTIVSAATQFTSAARMGMMPILMLFISIIMGFGTLLVVVCTLRRYS